MRPIILLEIRKIRVQWLLWSYAKKRWKKELFYCVIFISINYVYDLYSAFKDDASTLFHFVMLFLCQHIFWDYIKATHSFLNVGLSTFLRSCVVQPCIIVSFLVTDWSLCTLPTVECYMTIFASVIVWLWTCKCLYSFVLFNIFFIYTSLWISMSSYKLSAFLGTAMIIESEP